MVLLLAACQPRLLEDDPAQKSRAIATAESFLMAWNQGQADQVWDLLQSPYWANGEIVPKLDEQMLRAELKREMSGHDVIAIQGARFLTWGDVDILFPRLATKLKEAKFPLADLYFVVLSGRQAGEKTHQNAVFLMRLSEGHWKVVGMTQ